MSSVKVLLLQCVSSMYKESLSSLSNEVTTGVKYEDHVILRVICRETCIKLLEVFIIERPCF